MPGYHLLSIQVYDRLAGLYGAVITRVSLRAFVTSHISASENPDVKCYIEGFQEPCTGVPSYLWFLYEENSLMTGLSRFSWSSHSSCSVYP